jgi:glycine cleavage system H lipoate-binding protein
MFCFDLFVGSVARYACELAPPNVVVWTSGDTMKVTTVDPMTTEAIKPVSGLPLPQQGDIITTNELEVEVGEVNQQQQNHGHLAKIVTLTNGSGGTYHDDKPGKAIVNGISKSMKVETPPGDLIVTNGDSSHSAPKKLQDKTDSTASRAPRYFFF